jgi:hypothetical protein
MLCFQTEGENEAAHACRDDGADHAAVGAAAAGEDGLGEDVRAGEAAEQARGYVGPPHHGELRVHVQGRPVVHLALSAKHKEYERERCLKIK